MRLIALFALTAACFFGSQAHAGATGEMEKTKTGILPSGVFYNLYEVECADQTRANVARMERGRRWCTAYDGELSCYRRSEEAANNACFAGRVASTEQESDSSGI